MVLLHVSKLVGEGMQIFVPFAYKVAAAVERANDRDRRRDAIIIS